MEIHTSIQLKRRCWLFCLLGLLVCAACRNQTNHQQDIAVVTTDDDYSIYVHEDISVKQALELAQKENKMLWTVIGGTENCGYTQAFLELLVKTGFFEKYKDKFIFHACNPSVSGNECYVEVLRPEIMPNSYIFNSNGSIVSLYDFHGQNPLEFATTQVESVLNGNPYNPRLLKDYSMGGKRLLRHLEKLIDIGHKSLTGNKDTLLAIEKRLFEVDTLSRNFYYYYLLTQIAQKLDDHSLRDKSAEAAYLIFADKGAVGWADLSDSIKQYSATYREDQIKGARLLFEKEVIQYGKIAMGKVHESSITVENSGNALLVILNTHTSCDCVRIDYPKAPILPGEKSTVTFKYNANVKGVFLKSILFRSNAANKVQKVMVEGEVI